MKKIFGASEAPVKAAEAKKPQAQQDSTQNKKKNEHQKPQRNTASQAPKNTSSQSHKKDSGQSQENGSSQSRKPRHNQNNNNMGKHQKQGSDKPSHSPRHNNVNVTPLTPAKADNSWINPGEIPQEESKTAFLSMDLCPAVQRAIYDMDFKFCTPVQEGVLPISLKSQDVAAKAQTGTGKTAAFLISMYNHFVNNPQTEVKAGTPRALILAPTRELALQIGQDAIGLGKYCDIRVETFFGGMDFDKQAQVLRGRVDIAVATPGRLMDYHRRKMINLSEVEFLCIDEADRMLDMGFIPDVRRIVGYLPGREKRITQLYSATLSQSVLDLASSWLSDDYVKIEINPETIVSKNVTQKVFTVTANQKENVILWHLKNEPVSRMIIFANRKFDCERLADKLYQYGIDKLELLTGDIPQKKRMRILEEFRAGTVQVLVATDVAGRGIHVDDVSHVVNYELPYEPEDYVHRVGRTGRASATGKAISFADENSGFELPEIECYIEMQLPAEVPAEGMTDAHEKMHGNSKFVQKRSGNKHGGNRGGGGSRHQERSGGHHRNKRR
ncbi:DEAD/DEAH box helicase [Lentisphaera profundi]|uniref:DEAD/DEAH box helicase n=1 Tax=Lentisphaera profundi TaxID=1658616 RepID=A0ABY7VNZ8_9BACT|nr:DEAD/DEAH box helicase [Lentisphaera profundi]WDE95672.1 DEAD/DEAH box helicase [Lentisphaera profundi]